MCERNYHLFVTILDSPLSYSILFKQSACFSCCTGCSARVVNEYRARGSSFIRAVCADGSGKLLQDVSGVTELMSRVNLDDCVEIGQGFGDDDDF